MDACCAVRCMPSAAAAIVFDQKLASPSSFCERVTARVANVDGECGFSVTEAEILVPEAAGQYNSSTPDSLDKVIFCNMPDYCINICAMYPTLDV